MYYVLKILLYYTILYTILYYTILYYTTTGFFQEVLGLLLRLAADNQLDPAVSYDLVNSVTDDRCGFRDGMEPERQAEAQRSTTPTLLSTTQMARQTSVRDDPFLY